MCLLSRTHEGEGSPAWNSVSGPGNAALLSARTLQREVVLCHPSGFRGKLPLPPRTCVLRFVCVLFSYSRAVNLFSPEPSTRSHIKLARETECLAARRRRRATARRKKPRPFLLPARSCLPVIRRLPCDPSYRATLWAAPRVLREGSVRTFVVT